MARIDPVDARLVLGFVEATTGLEGDDPLPVAALRALDAVIPADLVEHAEHDHQRRLSSYVARDRPPEGTVAAWWNAFGPLITSDRARPQDGAHRMLDHLPAPRHQPTWYQDLLVSIGLRDVLKIWLPVEAPLRSVVLLSRTGSFSERDRRLLEVLQGQLARIRDGAALRRGMRGIDPRLSPREAEVLGWVARGVGNRRIGLRLGIGEATVAKHLENAYEKLDVHSRAAAVALARRQLGSAPRAWPARGPAGHPVPLLTPRELEVLSWAANGRQNSEIATELFITPRTVAKHLEHAYDKLGARSRVEAVALIRGWTDA